VKTPSSADAVQTGPARLGALSPLGFEFSFAFQPIVDAQAAEVISFEALVRGPHGEPSGDVFARVRCEDLYRFDQACRLKAIRLAAHLNLSTALNLNFFPNSVRRSSEYLRATLEASKEAGFPVERLVFEVSEIEDLPHAGSVQGMFEDYAAYGFQTAIDDFGAGFSGLRHLSEHRPDFVKLDRSLIAGIHDSRVRQVIVRGITGICRHLSMTLLAEGVETAREYHWLREAGIRLFQGFYFARPVFEDLAEVPPALFSA
jgi:EAL domain-containing protein (putative c-di-GMP-specific phosphodiesterase class I)